MVDGGLARRAWRALEAVHGAIYFSPQARARYAQLDPSDPFEAYFAPRAAAMGEASAETVIATFYNFRPSVVRGAVPSAWTTASPDEWIAARFDAAAATLDHCLDGSGGGDSQGGGPEVEVAGLGALVGLVRAAVEEACEHLEGRPLFAAHTRIDWPDDPIVALWWGQTLLREFRGDGHVAALVAEGIGGCEALVLHAATGEVSRAGLQMTRGWSDDEWQDAVDRLAERGLVDRSGAFTESGSAFRQAIEDRTDTAAAPPYAVIGEEGCRRLIELGRPLSKAVVASGVLPGVG